MVKVKKEYTIYTKTPCVTDLLEIEYDHLNSYRLSKHRVPKFKK